MNNATTETGALPTLADVLAAYPAARLAGPSSLQGATYVLYRFSVAGGRRGSRTRPMAAVMDATGRIYVCQLLERTPGKWHHASQGVIVARVV